VLGFLVVDLVSFCLRIDYVDLIVVLLNVLLVDLKDVVMLSCLRC